MSNYRSQSRPAPAEQLGESSPSVMSAYAPPARSARKTMRTTQLYHFTEGF